MSKLFYICLFILQFSYFEQLLCVLAAVDILKDSQGRLVYLYSDRHIKMYDENIQQFEVMKHILKSIKTQFHFLIEAPSSVYEDIEDNPPSVMSHILSFINKNFIPTVTIENIELRHMSGIAQDILYPGNDISYYSRDQLMNFETGAKYLKDLTLEDIFSEFEEIVKRLSNSHPTEKIILFLQERISQGASWIRIAQGLIASFNIHYKDSITYQNNILDIAAKLHKKPLPGEFPIDNCRYGLWTALLNAFSPLMDIYLAQRILEYKSIASLVIIAGGKHIREVKEKVLLNLGYTCIYSNYVLENSLTSFLKEEDLKLLSEEPKFTI